MNESVITMKTFDKSELDTLILFLDSKFEIEDEYHACVRSALKKSKNQNYLDVTIEKQVSSEQSLRDSLYLVDKHINNFNGIVIERIEMYIYNKYKNSSDTITITNPDNTVYVK
tara:strand:- start:2369 stop:2710 length:342 start_codon:yes stop_codon:yes gene_type:complete